jgi:hypothetical protein
MRSYLYICAIGPLHSSALWSGFDVLNTQTSVIKINSLISNGPKLQNYAQFGSSVANIGDLDGDGVDDLVVGAQGEGLLSSVNVTASPSQGAIYVLFMTLVGTVKSHNRIGHLSNGGPFLIASDEFGASVCSVGDVNGDGIDDIAVGAPGRVLGGVYLLFMKRDGTASKYRLIRGNFISKGIKATNSSNGPPIFFDSKFGNSLTSIGDFNRDGVPDLAVGQIDGSNGDGKVYLLLLDRTGTVMNYSTIGANVGGGPNINYFSGFASSLQSLRDKDGDGIIELAIGSNKRGDTPESFPSSGVVFICFLNSFGIAKYCVENGQLSRKNHLIPLQAEDACGSALGSIGDINDDTVRQQHPSYKKFPPRLSIEDLIVGCPQNNVGSATGKIMLYFLSFQGLQGGYTQLPANGMTLKNLAPKLSRLDLFGTSLTGYQDLDNNGIKEIVVGASGDDGEGIQQGAIYILFLGRLPYIRPYKFPLMLVLSIVGAFIGAVLIAIFLWIFRKKKNIVERSAIIVGHDIELPTDSVKKKKKKKVRANKTHVMQYADSYDM